MKRLIILVIIAAFFIGADWWEKVDNDISYNLNGTKILFIIGDDFDWLEVMVIKDNLEKWGAKVTIAGNRYNFQGHIWDIVNDQWTNAERKSLKPDILLEDINISDYNALFLPGGKGPENLLKESKELTLQKIKKANDSGLLIAAICHGPTLLAEADLVKGKKVTSFPDVKPLLESKGGIWVDEKIIKDGNIITGNWPHFALFSIELAKSLVK